MQVQHIGYRIRGFYRVAALGYLWDMTPKDAQRRFEILRFFNKHGAKSCAPKKRRTPKTDPRLVTEIRRLRTLYPNLGKSKRHVLLGPWCARHGIALPSVSRAVSSRPTSPASLKIKASSAGTPTPKTRR